MDELGVGVEVGWGVGGGGGGENTGVVLPNCGELQ